MQIGPEAFLTDRSGPVEYKFSRQAERNRAAKVAERPETDTVRKLPKAASGAAETSGGEATSQTKPSHFAALLDPPLVLAIQSNPEPAPRLNAQIAPLSTARTQIERLYDQRHPSFDYGQTVSDPDATMKGHSAAYREFLTKAEAVVEQMTGMDETGLLEMRFTVSGPHVDIGDRLKALMNQTTTPAVTQQIETALAARDRINGWLAENTAEHGAITEKGAAYAFAAASKAYQADTGLDRDTAMNTGADEGNRFHLSVARAAYNHYGVNPMTPADATERFGDAGVFSFASR